MGRARIRGAITLLIWACPILTHAEPTGTSAVVSLDTVEMRSGPSWKYHPTGKLPRGTPVRVHHEENGWLAVEPPEGTVSWVNHRFLSEFERDFSRPRNVVILGDRVQIRAGGDIESSPTEKVTTHLASGSIVEVLGPAITWDNSIWYPISPVDEDFRYLPREAVQLRGSPAGPSDSSYVRGERYEVRSTLGAGEELSSVVRESGVPRATPSGGADHPLLSQAEDAERTGDYATAERLYNQLRDLALRQQDGYHTVLLCDNRLNRVRRAARTEFVSAPATETSGGQSAPRPPAILRPPTVGNPAPVASSNQTSGSLTSTSATAQLEAIGPGVLRATSVFIDGRRAYAVEMDRGQSWVYVTAQQNVPLSQFVDRWVELYGVMLYRQDLRGGRYMSVARFRVLQ